MTKTRVPAIPNPSTIKDPILRAVVVALKEATEVGLGRRGDPLDRAATIRDLRDAGVVDVRGTGANYTLKFSGDTTDDLDYSKPPTPFNLTATGGFTSILVQWEFPRYLNYSHTEVWRSTENDRSTAAPIGISSFNLYSDPVETVTTYYYWVRLVSRAGIAGDFNALEGTEGTSLIPVADLLKAFEGEILSTHLHESLSTPIGQLSTWLDGITVEDFSMADFLNSLAEVVYDEDTGVAANSGLIEALDVRVTDNEGDLSTQASSITSLTSRIGEVEPLITDPHFRLGQTHWSTSYVGETVDGIAADDAAFNSTATGLRITGTKWLYYRNAIPVDTSRRYRVRFKVRQLVDASVGDSRVYAGVATLDGDFKNLTGGAGTHRYCAVSGYPLRIADGWQTYEGDIEGLGDLATNFRSNTAYVRPMLIVNYSGGNGTAEVATLEFLDVTDEYANATAIDGLTTRVSLNEGDISTLASDVTNLETAVFDGTTGLSATGDAVDALEVRVTATEGDLASTATSVTQLEVSAGRFNEDPANLQFNGSMNQVAPDGRPAGVVANFGSSDKSIISFLDDTNYVGLKLYSASDTSIGCALRAIKFVKNTEYTISYKIKASASAGTGFYSRIYFAEDTVGPDIPVSYVTHSSVHEDIADVGFLADNVSYAALKSNSSVSQEWVEHTHTYTHRVDNHWGSLTFLNWTGMGTYALHIKDVVVKVADPVVYSKAYELLETRVKTTEDGISSAEAEYVLKLDVNNRIAGFGLLNDGAVSTFEIMADQMAIINPAEGVAGQSGYVPEKLVFGTDNAGKTFIDGAFIKEATIDDAAIGSLSADKLVVTEGLASPFANIGTVTAGKLQGVNGKIDIDMTSGTFAINSGASGARLEMTEEVIKVYDANGTLRVQLGNLSK